MSETQSFDAYRFSSDLLTKLLARAAEDENRPKTLGYARLLAHEVAAPGDNEHAVEVEILAELYENAREWEIEKQQAFLAELLTAMTNTTDTLPPAC